MFCLEINTKIKGSKISGILFLNFHSWNCSRILENSFREFSFPGIKKSWKILSWKKIVLEFSQNNFTKKIFFLEFTVLEFSIPGIFHSWNSVLELSVPGILFHGIFLLPLFLTSWLSWAFFNIPCFGRLITNTSALSNGFNQL